MQCRGLERLILPTSAPPVASPAWDLRAAAAAASHPSPTSRLSGKTIKIKYINIINKYRKKVKQKRERNLRREIFQAPSRLSSRTRARASVRERRLRVKAALRFCGLLPNSLDLFACLKGSPQLSLFFYAPPPLRPALPACSCLSAAHAART